MTKAQTIKELRKKVAFSCRILGLRGVTQGSFGHVSVRIPGTDRILIKSKGPDEAALQFATERDIITIDINGKVIDAAKGLDAPHETDMHLAVLKAREDVQSVIHTHPDWVVALTASEKPLLPIFAAYNPPCMKLAVEGIPIYPRSVTIVNEELGKDFMSVMGEKNACLLLGHGFSVPYMQRSTPTTLKSNSSPSFE